MLQRLKVPHTLQWVVRLFIMYIVIFTLFRLASYILFNPDKYTLHGEAVSQYTATKVIPAFLLGFMYDARWISIILAPIVMASCIPLFTPFKNRRNKIFWSIYLVAITFMMLFFFGADFGHFQYVRTRLNASALNFFEDAKISLEMLWESYPILWIFLALGIVIFLLTYFINRSYFKVEYKNSNKSKYDYQRRWYLVTLAIMTFFIYGSITPKPLTTNDSFRKMDDEFTGFLALNPFQNFFTSLKFRNPGFKGNMVDEQKRALHYNSIAQLLQLPIALHKDTSYTRTIINQPNGTPPNVVLIMCESLSTYKTTMSGNALNTTPYMDSMRQQSIYFNRCFTPTFGTARGLFAWLTGVPDVQLSKFSSRNENAIHQHTIINDFKGYEKYYFIGGSPKFNNFNGLISNINNVHLYEEKDYNAKRVNVWGVSDKDMFLEANMILAKETKPFFAVIQTADNHEPYTIPTNETTFKISNIDKALLTKYGFTNNMEYNAVRYFDYSVATFIENAKTKAFFNNTIFVFFGDHGVIGDARSLYPDVWTSHRLTEEHVPLMYYAPMLLPTQNRNETVSQIDILPTVAGLAKQSYTNTSLGRDLLDSNKKGNYAFTIFHDAGKIGLVTDSFYYIHNYNTDDDELLPMYNNTKISKAIIQQKVPAYFKLTEGIYETSKWLLIHNSTKN